MDENEAKADKKESFPEREVRIMHAWKDNHIFESLSRLRKERMPTFFTTGLHLRPDFHIMATSCRAPSRTSSHATKPCVAAMFVVSGVGTATVYR